MTLWAVEVISAEHDPVRFPAQSRDSAVESAGRINDWVFHMVKEHPAYDPKISADVVVWADSPEEHAELLAKSAAFMAEEEEEF